MTELFVLVWAGLLYLRWSARITFQAQSVKLAPVMKKIRQGLIPAALIAGGLGSFSQAHSMPGPVVSGASMETHYIEDTRHDGISLDEAVRRAEAQYRARVVRTDVQDEDGRKVYVLKLLSENGRVMTVRIDAATGRMR
jgi:peptidase YpeB-like protein